MTTPDTDNVREEDTSKYVSLDDVAITQALLADMHGRMLGLRGLDPYEKQEKLAEIRRLGLDKPVPAVSQDEKDALHEEFEALGVSHPATCIAVHALIDSGRITELKCMMPTCRFPDEGFKNEFKRDPKGLSLDHIIMRCDNGGHRPNNIRLAHYACNAAWATGRTIEWGPGVLERYRALGAEKDWEWAKRAGPKIGAALRGRKLSDDHRQAISQGLKSGRKVDSSPTKCPKCDKVFKGERGVKIHAKRAPDCSDKNGE